MPDPEPARLIFVHRDGISPFLRHWKAQKVIRLRVVLMKCPLQPLVGCHDPERPAATFKERSYIVGSQATGMLWVVPIRVEAISLPVVLKEPCTARTDPQVSRVVI